MELLNEIYEKIEKELWELAHRECWTPLCAEAAYHLVKTMKYIKEIKQITE